LGGFKYFT
jgi:hypothetical protein